MAVHFDLDRMEEVLQNHELWWKGELDRPLVYGFVSDAYAPSHEAKAPLLSQANCHDFSWTPEQIIEAYDRQLSQYEFIGDGYPQICLDAFGPGVVAAFCGAKLDNSSGRVWFFPKEEKDISEIHATYDPNNIWSRRIKDIYRAGLDRWNGTVIMGMPDLGGVLDIVASLYGSEDLLYALIDEPEEVQRIIGEVETAWYEAYNDFAEVLRPQGAFTDWNAILSRTPSYIIQCDICNMISPNMFREFVLETLRKDTKRLSHTIYHLDGEGELQHLDDILSLKDLQAVQYVQGAGKPGPMHWLDVYRKIMGAGKQLMMSATPTQFLEVLDVIHGTPFTGIGVEKKDIDFAKKVLNAR